MKIAFFGTPFFAAEILSYLLEKGIPIKVIVTQPDRPKGRSLQLLPSEVKALALKKAPHLPILQPEKASDEVFIETIVHHQLDLFVVVAYGQILSQKLLDVPKFGSINVHASLLPKYRGAAPMQRCLMAGEKQTGISIQKMVRKMDAGDVIATVETPIFEEMTFGELEKKLIELARPLLLQVIREFEKRIPPATPQNHDEATFAPKIEDLERKIDWNLPSNQIYNLIRALSPKPGAWCWVVSGDVQKRLKILKAKLVEASGRAGEFQQNGIVCCGEKAIQLIEVQPEGKKSMVASDWLRGQRKILFL